MAFAATGILIPPACLGQGTVYLSNLSLQSTGNASVASDSWHAQAFDTGTNRAGYVLNFVELRMVGASGNPSDFMVTIHTNRYPPVNVYPAGSIAQLVGSTNPVAPGINTYIPASPITLSGNGGYFIVVTAGTQVANGAYSWSMASSTPDNLAQGWFGGQPFYSSDGISWAYSSSGFPQFAVSATPIPEPSTIALLGPGGYLLAVFRQTGRRRSLGKSC